MDKNLINKIIKNKVLLYLTTRYLTYGLQFVIGLIIAGKLGAYYLGVYGFIQLILMYFTNINFGINHSLNVLLVHHKEDQEICKRYIANALIVIGWMAIVVAAIFVASNFLRISSFEKYHADKYFLWICLIAVLQYLNSVFMTVVRVRNKLNLVTFMQSFNVLLNFICIFVFSGQVLIASLVACLVISNTTYIVLAFRNKIVPELTFFVNDHSMQRELVKKGFYLFIYNSCFYFIIISIRTIISKYYTVEEFGIFTFSYSLGNSLMLLSSALSFVIFPKLIDRLSSKDNNVISKTLTDIKVSYTTSCHMLVYAALPLFPLLIIFLPKYAEGITAMNLIALTVVLTTNTMGYATLLIARNKEKQLAIISAVSLIANVILALLLVKIIHVSYLYVILATTMAYALFSLMVVGTALKTTGQFQIGRMFEGAFPAKLFIPYTCAIIISIIGYSNMVWLPIAVFIMINYNEVKTLIYKYIKKLIVKPEIIDLK